MKLADLQMQLHSLQKHDEDPTVVDEYGNVLTNIEFSSDGDIVLYFIESEHD